MKNIYTLFFVFLILVFSFCSCKDDQVNGPGEVDPPVPNPYSTAHFTFYYTSYDSLSIRATADSIERHYSRILADLLTDTVVKTSIHFYKTHDELAAGAGMSLPPWAIGLATAKDQIHMISPRHPDYEYAYMITVLVHEYTHCITLNIRPNFSNNPRWLWESVALYESGMFVHPSDIDYMVQQNPPPLSEMNSLNNTQIYDVGYLLAEYIIENWDRQHLKDMILMNGNIPGVLGMTVAEFQTGWFQFVKNKYGI